MMENVPEIGVGQWNSPSADLDTVVDVCIAIAFCISKIMNTDQEKSSVLASEHQ